MSDRDVTAVRERLLSTHEATIRSVLDAADQVAATWNGREAIDRPWATDTPHETEQVGVTDRAAVVGPLERDLADAGVLDRLPNVLADAAAVLGARLPAEPVAAPPYVTITSRGPVLRATLADRRLVVSIQVFRVERDGTPRYVRDATSPADALLVEFRSTRS